MALFKYKATTPEGEIKEGDLEAASLEIAISALQKRNLIVVSLDPVKKELSFFKKDIFSSTRIKKGDVVIFSRQIATLFEAKVPILTSFKLLASETENVSFRKILVEVVGDIEGGAKVSQAMSRHPKAFSEFYVNMVRAGEESGKLEEVFLYLADYLERSYELTSKAVKALIYPAFVISTFIIVMVLMMVVVVPKLTDIIKESGQEAPVYTRAVIMISDILKSYGVFVLLFLVAVVVALWRYSRTKTGSFAISKFQISTPFIGVFYRKLYLSRIADNLQTLITGGVSMIRSLEITADVVGNHVYKSILKETIEAVKGGANISESFSRHEEISPLVTQMIRIGEETGKLDFILKTLARFYKREVDEALETLVTLIEPAMIIVLGVGVGLVLASVLVPIYNIALSV
jgi:type IV pilus assembly protein PilC